jgi:hypothetical protein
VSSLALAGLAVLLFTPTARADEPTVVSAASAERPKSGGQGVRTERATAERYARIRAEFEAERAASRQAATKAENLPAKGAAEAKRPIVGSPTTLAARGIIGIAMSGPSRSLAILWKGCWPK